MFLKNFKIRFFCQRLKITHSEANFVQKNGKMKHSPKLYHFLAALALSFNYADPLTASCPPLKTH